MTTLRTLLPDTASVSRDEIENKVDMVLAISMYSDLDRDKLIREAESLYRIRVEDYRIIEKERHIPWVSARKAELSWEFWSRYRDFLQVEKNFAPEVLNKLDRLTDRILDGLFDPSENIRVDKKGLVVGQVQSGKTANYSGLICKAADAGFKLIVVLAGIHNNLRSQTQLRLDEGFLGFDTQHTRAFKQDNVKIGVGRLASTGIAHSLTSSLDNGDFTQPAANSLGLNFNTNEPIIAVVKKNPNVLKRLYQWLSAQAITDSGGTRIIQNKALLLIDDEADNASINISNDPEKRSTINRRITDIIGLFAKTGYVGYTATPFANIFIPLEEDNLFPRDFIVNIPPPSNYIGPEKIFGFRMIEEDEPSDDVLPIVNRIDDYSEFVPDRHKKDDQLPSGLPDSLKLAIRCFILTCAVRIARGQATAHNSMLVHVSRFVRWQDHITELVQNQFDYYRMGIDQNDPGTIELFRSTFEDDRENYKSYRTVTGQILHSPLSDIDPEVQNHEWHEVMPHLYNAVSKIAVKAIHGGSKEALDYYDHKSGLSVIAVGGNKLSRGLTLEGLSVSYYLRASRMYDTLMQMGRWFGYRPGYVDLCRLFTSRELNEWFCHITHASEELRQEFDYMSDVAGSTPEQYALRVRTHPGVLQISATNKLKEAVTVNVSHSGRLVESYELRKDIPSIDNNYQNTRSYIETLPTPDDAPSAKNSFIWFDRPAGEVINFLEGFKTPENLKAYDPQNLSRFINKQLPNGELTDWRVALMSKKDAVSSYDFQINGSPVKVGAFVRKQDDSNSDQDIYYIKKSHIISPGHEFIDLQKDEYEQAMRLTKEARAKSDKQGEPMYPSGEIVRNRIKDPKNPLLLIYLLDPVKSETRLPEGTNPFVGYAISFPRSDYNAFISYAVNKQLLDKFNIDFSPDEFDDDED